MMISNEYLQKVKDAFESLVEWSKIRIDIDFPFFNVYEWKGQLIFSNGYKSYNMCCEFANQEAYKQIPEVWNAFSNRVRWIGSLNGSKVIIDKDY